MLLQGLFAVARRFYLLFQQHCTYANAAAISRIVPGCYGYHQVRHLGNNAILMVPDSRTERSPTQVTGITCKLGWAGLLLYAHLISHPAVP